MSELAFPVGAPCWVDLFTSDPDKGPAFYGELFGWKSEEAGEEYGGYMDATAFLPEGVPASWSIYFRVEDADATLAQTVNLGGSIIQPAEDTPYGRLAQAADPTGALFKLVAGS